MVCFCNIPTDFRHLMRDKKNCAYFTYHITHRLPIGIRTAAGLDDDYGWRWYGWRVFVVVQLEPSPSVRHTLRKRRFSNPSWVEGHIPRAIEKRNSNFSEPHPCKTLFCWRISLPLFLEKWRWWSRKWLCIKREILDMISTFFNYCCQSLPIAFTKQRGIIRRFQQIISEILLAVKNCHILICFWWIWYSVEQLARGQWRIICHRLFSL